MVIAGPELGRWEDVMVVDVVKDAFGDDLLKELSTAFQERDGTVSLG